MPLWSTHSKSMKCKSHQLSRQFPSCTNLNPCARVRLCRLFGFLMIISFCEFNFIMRHFLFLKTVTGKGFFNLFCASMFLVGNNDEIWGYIVMGGLCFCGVFFVLVGCACISGYDNKDLSSADLKSGSKSGAPE